MKILTKKEPLEVVNKKNEEEKKRIKKVLEDITNLLKSLKEGDFTAKPKFPEAFLGEEEPILQYGLGMISSLTNLLKRVRNVFSKIKVSMQQINEATQDLAESTENCFDEVSSLDMNSRKIVQGIEETAQKTQNIALTCEKVGDKIANVTADINTFENLMNDIANYAINLKEVLKSIESISKQINLLSFNARIEAAKAGEQGKGFSVIAFNLAQLNDQTAKGSQSSAQIIKDILEPIEEAKKRIKNIVDKSAEITQSAESIVIATQQIAQTTQIQSALAEEIAGGIHSIGELIENNAAFSEQLAASNEEILVQLMELEKLLQNFKINK